MAKNSKDKNQKRHIARRVNFVGNGEKCKMYKVKWCDEGMKLAEIATNNGVKIYLNPRMKYIMVRLDNWYITIVQ